MQTENSAKAKLERIAQQLRIVKATDFSYPDCEIAIEQLLGSINKTKGKIDNLESRSPQLREALLREVNSVAIHTTQILGIIVRSSSTRNAFEFYNPFLTICKKALDENCKLILSSEWDYTPFTFPQNLEELPNFVIIGLPASESDNTLVFPVAGHELGHSIWSKEGLQTKFQPDLYRRVLEVFVENRSKLDELFPEVANADLNADMFAQHLISISVSQALSYCMELYCDFVGLCIFGESFLRAFEYLIAPTLSGQRSNRYPENKNRAKIISETANKIGISIEGYDSNFKSDTQGKNKRENFLQDMADLGTNRTIDELFEVAKNHLAGRNIQSPNDQEVQKIKSSFERGIPYSAEAGLGSLVSAAWTYVENSKGSVNANLGREHQELVNDLVLKSAEIAEYAEYMR